MAQADLIWTPGPASRLGSGAAALSETLADASAGTGAPRTSPAGLDEPGPVEVPSGTVTFLLTDIEGSTRLWGKFPAAMRVAIEQHDRLLTEVIEGNDGVVIRSRGEGDSFFAVFPSAVAAVEAAGACQLRLAQEAWPAGVTLRVRMGLHTGEAQAHGGDRLDHAPVNCCSRVRDVAHAGQVLLTRTTREVVGGAPGDGLGMKELGAFELPGLVEPVFLYQLTHPDLVADFPPVPARPESLGNLPLPVSSFIGRTRELKQAAAAMAQARVVTLIGPGGVGKTRLALQAATQAAGRFADGVRLCELASIRDPAGVDDAVAALFSVIARVGQGIRETLAEFLRTKVMLLVLDNCEHLIDEVAALARVLQRSCPSLVILATSREDLGIDGERLVPVPPLGVPGAYADLTAIADAEAVRLFADRAAAVKPGFRVTAENAAAVTALVRRLDGLALAIELKAALVPAMTPTELARRPEDGGPEQEAGRRGADPRHQTLRAAIDWSFNLLTEPEQTLLGRLSVFAGGCTMAAGKAVCSGAGIDPGAVLGLLVRLEKRSLVVAEDKGPGTRYRLLEPIREYGEEHLDQAGQADQWRARHAGYYADLLGRAREHAHDCDQEMFWMARLGAEQDNLLAAWSWAIGTGNVGTAFQILAGFAPVEVWSTYPLLLAEETALELPGAAAHPGYPLALAVSAVFASNRADVARAQELCRLAAEANARQASPNWRVEETICAARSSIAITVGAFADAARLAEQAARLALAGGDLADASVHLTMAVADHLVVGDAPSAIPLANEAVSLTRQVGAPALITSSQLALGATVASTDPRQARSCLGKSRKLGYDSGRDLVWATAIAFLLGDTAGTLECGSRAIISLRWGGDRIRVGFALYMIAGALAATQPDAAAIILGAAGTCIPEPPLFAQFAGPAVTEALGEERAGELRAEGVDMDWDQALAYTLAEASQALGQGSVRTR
jgi:predicted ATPase/class 3 adenylate cyclase